MSTAGVPHRVRVVTPSRTEPPEPGEWPDWLVALTSVALLAASAVTAAIILAVAWRAFRRYVLGA